MVLIMRDGESEPISDHLGDIFPALGVWIGGGMIVGVATSTIIAKVMGHGNFDLLISTVFNACLGGVLGLFLGLSRGIYHLSEPLNSPEPASLRNRLWDPWLDSGRDVGEVRSELEGGPVDEAESLIQVESTPTFPAERGACSASCYLTRDRRDAFTRR